MVIIQSIIPYSVTACMSNKDVSLYDEHSEWQLSAQYELSLSPHLHHRERRNNPGELTGGSLHSSEVAHNLMLEISAVSAHIKAASINKCWLCPSAFSFTSLRGWRGRRGWGGRLNHRIDPEPEITLFSLTLKWGLFLNRPNGWKNKGYESPAYFIIRCHTAAHLHKHKPHCSLLYSGSHAHSKRAPRRFV